MLNRRDFLRQGSLYVAAGLVLPEVLDRLNWIPKRLWTGFGSGRSAASQHMLLGMDVTSGGSMTVALQGSANGREWNDLVLLRVHEGFSHHPRFATPIALPRFVRTVMSDHTLPTFNVENRVMLHSVST